MIYCFDTSAINRLVDDPERGPIVTALLSTGSIRITAYNVLEVAKTGNDTRRTALMQMMVRLSNGKRPLDRPNTILLSYAAAHATRSSSAVVNADPNLEGVWTALNQPDLIDEEARSEALAWADSWEGDFSALVAGDRNQFQALFRTAPNQRPAKASSTLRAYSGQKARCRSIVGDVYRRQTGGALSDSGYDVLMREPAWALYLLGYAYAVHHRAIQERDVSERRNAGAVDLGQAVYLTLCDRFITDDRAQCRALRLLNSFNTKRHARVLSYDGFRGRLLPLDRSNVLSDTLQVH
jgi:hypothetical protein